MTLDVQQKEKNTAVALKSSTRKLPKLSVVLVPVLGLERVNIDFEEELHTSKTDQHFDLLIDPF